MLILSRKQKERIRIKNPVTNEAIWVAVVRTGLVNVRLGIDAAGWEVDREEIAKLRDSKPATRIGADCD